MEIFKSYGKILLPFITFVIFCFISCSEEPASVSNDDTSVSGVLIDEQGTPVPLAIVEISNSLPSVQSIVAKDTTDEDGYFSIASVPEDISSLNIKITHDDFKSFEEQLTVFKSNTSKLIKLQHLDTCLSYIKIYTYSNEDSLKMSGVEVRLFRDNNLIRKASTENGELVFENVCPGTYVIRYFKDGYKLVYKNFQFGDLDSLISHVYMQSNSDDSCCTASILAHVTDSSDASPIQGATIYIFRTGGTTITGTTDQYGNFQAFNLCAPGSYTVKAMKDGYSFMYYNVEFTKCDTQNVILTLNKISSDTCCTASVRAHVIDSTDSSPIAGATVYVFSNGGDAISGTTDQYGYFQAYNLCAPGKYTLKAMKDGYSFMYYNVEFTKCDTQNITLKIRKISKDSCCTAELNVFAFDSEDSSPIPYTSIMIFKDNQTIVNDSTGSDGKFAIKNLCAPGTYTVRVAKDGYMRKYLTVVYSKCNAQSFDVGLVKE